MSWMLYTALGVCGNHDNILHHVKLPRTRDADLWSKFYRFGLLSRYENEYLCALKSSRGISIVCGISGIVVKKKFWSQCHCWFHLAVTWISSFGTFLALALAIWNIIRYRIQVHWIKNAWTIIPFTISYNQMVRH